MKKRKNNLWKIILGVIVIGFIAYQMGWIPLKAGTSSVTVCVKNSVSGNNVCGARVCVWNTWSDCYICQNTQSNGCTPTFTGAFTEGQTTMSIVGNYNGLTNPQVSYSAYLTSGHYTKTYSISSNTDSSSMCGQIEYYNPSPSKCGISPTTTTTTIEKQVCSNPPAKILQYLCVSGYVYQCQSSGWESRYICGHTDETGKCKFGNNVVMYVSTGRDMCEKVGQTTTTVGTTTTLRTTTTIRTTTTTTPSSTTTTTTIPPSKCVKDTDCKEGEVCIDGECVKECKISGIPCEYLIIGGLLALVAFGFVYMNKKKGKRRSATPP